MSVVNLPSTAPGFGVGITAERCRARVYLVDPGRAMADPLHKKQSFLALLERAQGGEEAALEELLISIQPPVISYLRRRLQEPRLESFVEDVLAEVLLRVFRFHQDCKARSDRQVVAWVLTIAHNEAVRLLESSPIKYGVLLGERDPARMLLPKSNGKMRPPEPGTFAPEEEDELSEGSQILLQVLSQVEEQLDPELRRILYLRLVEGRGWEEIGAEFDITTAAAKRRFQRAQPSLAKKVLAAIEELPATSRRLALHFLQGSDRGSKTGS